MGGLGQNMVALGSAVALVAKGVVGRTRASAGTDAG